MSAPATTDLRSLIGSYRTVGPDGPAYEILELLSDAGESSVLKIQVLTSGEEVEYPLSEILSDPVAD